MSNLNSWEDDPAAQQDENLSQQAQQQLNINHQPNPNAGSFRPGVASFQPGAQSFNPGQQYGGYVPQYQQYYNQGYGGGGYPQYGGGAPGQGQGQGQGYQQYGQQGGYGGQPAYNQGYGQQQYGQYNQQQQQQQPQQVAPTIAKRENAPAAAPAAAQPTVKKEGGAKVLSIGGEAPKPKAKVLSIGATATPPKEAKEEKKEPAAAATAAATAAPEAGAKATAAKAIEKTGATSKSGKTSPAPSSGRSSPTAGGPKGPVRDADAVAKEQSADVDDETLEEVYGKEHVNIIFIGHVDAGKSTLGGSILIESMLDGRCGFGFLRDGEETLQHLDALVTRRTFLDDWRCVAGRCRYSRHLCRKGEYETGFERGGQTREHAMLAKTQGVNKLVVVINKMDDPTVEWSHERYIECTTKLAQFLKGTGYNLKTDVMFMPIAAQQTMGIKTAGAQGEGALRKLKAPFMMPVAAKYKDMGTIIEGKIEAGVVKKGMSLVMMPNRQTVEATAVYGETEDEVNISQCGDQVRLRLRGAEEEDIMPGFVLCSPKRLVHNVTAFEAQIRILELKSILSAGFNCVLHVHAAIEEVTFAALLHKLQKGTNRKSKLPPSHAKKGDSIIARMEVTGGAGSVCVERFEDYPQMGRFTLRDQGQTIAIGKITKLITNDA
ncbi:eukaryotic peptide chain release factor GTP-binding subunit [Verticillium alfalfae VaMs.102]|uniref:Elongation factor 1-alpha n=1 Tax=Verticillium alfalfae (strain VaMs.102 / ATCC MYA-4576 / FGSC 10136) TaxID=526221 RepID=C9SWL3_VERA1|nr:eukaryotic peptide chain release factor GTP-binding subunit [Verticillium alfalfae VaMs.102]EEY23178.1 eukaryotic peptide chain release factor GTP-binding subunit [Verticillium alfalfae VaMs.102]